MRAWRFFMLSGESSFIRLIKVLVTFDLLQSQKMTSSLNLTFLYSNSNEYGQMSAL